MLEYNKADKVDRYWKAIQESETEDEVKKQKRREEFKLEETKYTCNRPWGYKMGFTCDEKVENAREILKTLGYSDVEEWKDLKKQVLHDKLAQLK